MKQEKPISSEPVETITHVGTAVIRVKGVFVPEEPETTATDIIKRLLLTHT